MRRLILLGVLAALVAAPARAQPVGEAHRMASDTTASLRDADHRDQVRVTIWYPAAAGTVEHRLTIDAADKPLFDVGDVAADAPLAADAKQLPVVLLSHGFGGAARIMGWFGIALARDGYLVVAVDHPGNNGVDRKTVAGAILWWDRVDDLRAALAAVQRDKLFGPHVDVSRIGVAGFSAGGFTALMAAGARVDPPRLQAFCAAHPDDGICRPQLEFQMTQADVDKALAEPDVAAEMAHAGDDHVIPNLRAAFAMAPALVQAIDPASLAAMRVPVRIILGDADTVATPATNGLVAAQAIPGGAGAAAGCRALRFPVRLHRGRQSGGAAMQGDNGAAGRNASPGHRGGGGVVRADHAAGADRAPQAAPNPLDVIPDKMPFDIPYGAPVSLERAQAVIAAALAEAKKHDWKEAVAVVDSSGNLVAFARMDGTQLAGAALAEHKARVAVTSSPRPRRSKVGIDGGSMHVSARWRDRLAAAAFRWWWTAS